ncbi:MAG: hypothetical protein PHE55_17040 [Methylococcaceae bacterium]|nr:hypothetical protein [Methylococcaceae bacterium]
MYIIISIPNIFLNISDVAVIVVAISFMMTGAFPSVLGSDHIDEATPWLRIVAILEQRMPSLVQ